MRTTYSAALGAVFAAAAFAQTDWPTYGNDLAGTRYSPLKQIDTTNVTKLVRAWTYHMNPGTAAPAAAPAAPPEGWRWPQLVLHAPGHQRRHVSHHGLQPRGRVGSRDGEGTLDLRSQRRLARG